MSLQSNLERYECVAVMRLGVGGRLGRKRMVYGSNVLGGHEQQMAADFVDVRSVNGRPARYPCGNAQHQCWRGQQATCINIDTHALGLIRIHAQSKTVVVPSLHRLLREKGEADVRVRLTLVDVDNSHMSL